MSLKCNHIAVLLKIVPDPDGIYEQDADRNVVSVHLPQIPSIFDENALEAALRIKEETGCKVTVLSVGQKSHEASLKRALAMGASEIVLIESPVSSWDSAEIASILAGAIKQLEDVDLVLGGREAADTGAGLVGPYVAQLLGMPFLTLVTRLAVEGDVLKATRPTEGGHDDFTLSLPVLLTVSGEVNRPRMPSVMNTMKAKKTPATMMEPTAAESGQVVSASVDMRRLADLTGSCEIIDAADATAAASALITKLREERVI